MSILEQVIDSKLFATYSQDVVESFYKDFQENWKTYEAENSDAVETLIGFTDFNKFKKQMLEFKAGFVDCKKEDLNKVTDYSKKDETYFESVL